MQRLGLVLLGVMLVGIWPFWSKDLPHSHAQEAIVPRFEAGDCPPEVLQNAPRHLECGRMFVQEDRHHPDSRTINFPVYIFKAQGANPAGDALIYLEGGPGAGGSRLIPYFSYLFAEFNQSRDVILYDQRGTGYAEPSLTCDAYTVANFEAYAGDYSVEAGAAYAAEAFLGCYEAFLAAGIDMNAYNSAESAADLDELRAALGYEQWNLYGISYGTRLALTTMRDFPAGLRSVVIDSVFPPQGDLYLETPDSGAAAIERLFEQCAADAACQATYPDLEAVFYATVEKLNAVPVEIEVYRASNRTWYTAQLDGDLLVGVLFLNLYSSAAIRELPYVIYTAAAGQYNPIRELVSGYFVWDDIATGMHYAVNCNEELAFNEVAEVENASDDIDPRLAAYFDMDNYITLDICAAWTTDAPNPIEDEPVVSSIPTLVLAGELDPITPYQWGQLSASTLANSFFFLVSGGGHGVTFSYPCAVQIMADFLDNPHTEPPSSCLSAIPGPDFVTVPVQLD